MTPNQPRRRALAHTAVAFAALALTAGCGSSPTSPGAGTQPASGAASPGASAAAGTPATPGASASGGGELTYSGAESGTAKFTSSACTVAKGELYSFGAPADDNAPPPKVGGVAGGGWSLTFGTAAHPGGFVKTRAAGVTAKQNNGVWTVTFVNAALTATYSVDSPPLTVNGSLTCGTVAVLP
ncbi:hypothetical protein F0L68_02110 [Solihabitans fulvus]|uniref:Lipoprotein antigen n=1 Tax=Solihabitans fulvus TaxID=1892852 RepID=A0A5B2XT69_9PSEU|nr:hypothetical protein [Solihabitans fulvus]KAA2266553.1 hypothetical protein F0L68_02110 [Solihabitans fulvus]